MMNETNHCWICCKFDDQEGMFLLSYPVFQGRTGAQIIQDCFGLALSESEEGSFYCTCCKKDIISALTLVKRIRESIHRLKSISLISEQTPKVEIIEPTDRTIVSVFIDETEIKTEEENSELGNDSTRTRYSPDLLSEFSKKRGRVRKHNLIDVVPVISKVLDNESNPTKEYKNVEKLRKLSTHSIRSDEGISASSSDSDDTDTEADGNLHGDSDECQEKKRLYYGVKSNSQPKRCCGCKNLPLDTPEKVKEHSVKYHSKMRMVNPKDYQEKIFECSVCFTRFETKKLYLQHQRKMYVDMLHPCKQCDEEFANFYVLQKHMKNDHQRRLKIHELEEMRIKSNICCGCRIKFGSQDELKEHASIVHLPQREQNFNKNTVECDVCYKSYKSAKYLKDHRLRFFKKKNLICSQCGRSFRERSQLEGHEDSHRNVRKYECPICQAKFSMKASWQVHVKYHGAQENFHCEYCGKGFRKKGLMKAHLRIHSTDRPHKCPMCPLTFTQKNRLNSHILEHSGLKSFKCDRCSASYVHQRALRRHVRDKHEGIQSFKCNICPKGFIEQKPLLIHLKTHERSSEATFSKS
ncbi:zinc finger protein interacting with ribonucleoprotein K-like [Topomyia yanbarensis]|uniref:zinc finger protein interacting with ribonucleoprotein K-like n=1 Tax=Topomyia yanbarensis TaxID=2498891 RepID=UPI00273C31B9|nr:zinc finger protein interacting with ribonucleoprotein K-like [Topomyia yanbarensis]